MAKLVTLLEQDLDKQPPTVVTQATTWRETVLALVKLQEIGLGVYLPVKVFRHIHKQLVNMYLALAYLVNLKLYGSGMTVQPGPWVGFRPLRTVAQTCLVPCKAIP